MTIKVSLNKIKPRKPVNDLSEENMNEKIKKTVEWLIGELLANTDENIMISVVYDKYKNEARIYLNGERIATISEMVAVFNWVLSDEQIVRLWEVCK